MKNFTKNITTLLAFLFTMSFTVNAQDSPLFFSEYAEGSSYNKYVEIYNGSDSEVDLANYEIWKIANGGEWKESSLSLSGSIGAGEVFVVAYCAGNNCSDELIIAQADLETNSSTMNYNGDDAIGLAYEGVLIDAIGTNGADPGSQFSVCESGDTKDNTLVRNCDVTVGVDWSVSASAESCQWTVLPNNTWDYLMSELEIRTENFHPKDEPVYNYDITEKKN